MSSIRLGVVGYGDRINSVISSSLREVEPDIRVVGIVDPDETGACSRLNDCDKDEVDRKKGLCEYLMASQIDQLYNLCNIRV